MKYPYSVFNIRQKHLQKISQFALINIVFEEDPSKVVFGRTCVSHRFCFFVWSYYVFLRSEFRVVMSITISAHALCSVRLYLQLFVGVRLSCVRCLCLFAHNSVQHILCCVFLCFSFSSVPYANSFSSLFISDCPVRFSLRFIYATKI